MSDTSTFADEPAGGKKKTVIVTAIAAIVLASAAGGAFWYLRKSPKVVAQAAPRSSERGVLPFEPFVVNLADPHAGRFLRVTVQLVVASEKAAEHIRKTQVLMMQARSAILEILTTQTAERLVTPEGKSELKKAIAERVGAALDEEKVLDVLFSDFVVQF